MSVDLTDADTDALRRRASTGRRPEPDRLYRHAVERHERRRRSRLALAVGAVVILAAILASVVAVRRREPPGSVFTFGTPTSAPAPFTGPSTPAPAPSTSATAPAGSTPPVRPTTAVPFDPGAVARTGGIMVSDRGDLVVIDPDAATRTVVVPGMIGSWSPDRRELAGGPSSPTAGDGLSVVALDGSTRRQVYGSAAAPPSDPAWSPDGQRLAFTVPANNPDTIIVVNRDGSGERTVGRGRYPAWSADGRSIYANTLDEDVQIQRIDVDRATTEVVPLGPGQHGFPAAGPAALAYADHTTGQIWISALDGSGARPISDCARPECASDITPRWSPDGRRLTFVRTTANGDVAALVVVSVDAGAEVARFAATDPQRFSVASWR